MTLQMITGSGQDVQYGPGSQQALRERNLEHLLDTLKTRGPATQRELATQTGLSPATVSNLVKILQASGRVRVTAIVSSGRRANQVHAVAEVRLPNSAYL